MFDEKFHADFYRSCVVRDVISCTVWTVIYVVEVKINFFIKTIMDSLKIVNFKQRSQNYKVYTALKFAEFFQLHLCGCSSFSFTISSL